MTRQRGFTLIELMTVVTIFAVAATLALVSVGRSRNATAGLDRFANTVAQQIREARRRAVEKRKPFLLEVHGNDGTAKANTVQYCEVPSTAQLSCPVGPPFENSPLTYFGKGGTMVNWRQDVDVGQGPSAALQASPALVYFMPTGAVDTNTGLVGLQGFTSYIQGTDDLRQKRKLVLYPAGSPRITDSW
jgi:prepilin-type N-terminal cleavage/methylation domain-containing protein